MAIFLPQRWRNRPEQLLQVDYGNPSTNGLCGFYDLRAGRWKTNVVTGQIGGSVVGTGATFNEAGLVTSGDTSNYVDLAMTYDPATRLLVPITIISGWKHISGVVDWSLMSRSGGSWTGYYGSGAGTVISTNANSFDGNSASTPGPVANAFGIVNTVYTLAAANDLRVVSGGGVLATDTSAQAPDGGYTINKCALGVASHDGSVDNAAVAWIEYFGVLTRAVPDDERRELSINTWQLFKKRQRVIYSFASMGAPQNNPAFLLNLM